ncbi:MAG: sulfate reduction electron transfer complex DsrMKJOP subunit DsrJ [Bacillota bacterium]
MYDAGKIIPGLVVFVGLATIPLWYNAGKVVGRTALNLGRPVIQALPERACVEPAAYMRTSHMQLLKQWRDQAIREGRRYYVAGDGKRYEISLQNTCLRCHAGANPAGGGIQAAADQVTVVQAGQSHFDEPKFCATCHRYADVKPDCWNCHIGSGEGGQ